MDIKKKKKYVKPCLSGEPFFEAVALACCKATAACSSGTGKNKNACGRPQT